MAVNWPNPLWLPCKLFEKTVDRLMGVTHLNKDILRLDGITYVDFLRRSNPSMKREGTSSPSTKNKKITSMLRFPVIYHRIVRIVEQINQRESEVPKQKIRVLVLGSGSERGVSYQAVEIAAMLYEKSHLKSEMTVVDGDVNTLKAVSNMSDYRVESSFDLSDMVVPSHYDEILNALIKIMVDGTGTQLKEVILQKNKAMSFKVDHRRLSQKVSWGVIHGLFDQIDYGSYPQIQLDLVISTVALTYCLSCSRNTYEQQVELFARIVNTTKRGGKGKLLFTEYDFPSKSGQRFEDNVELVKTALRKKGLIIDVVFHKSQFDLVLEVTNNTPE